MNRLIQLLWPEIKPFKARFLVLLLLGALIGGLKSASPMLLQELTAIWADPTQKDMAIILPLALAGIWFLTSIGRYFLMFWMKYTGDIIAVGLRRRLMDKYLSLNLSFLQKFSRGSGGLISRMINDIHIIQDGLYKMADLMREPVVAVATFSYLLYIDWMLTVFILATLPLISLILKNLARSLRKYSHKMQSSMEDLTKTLKESLDGTRVVQSFNLEAEMRNKFDNQADEFLRSRKKIISREEGAGPVSESLTSFALAGLLIYIGQRIFDGQFTIDEFVGFFAAVGMLADSARKIQNGYIKLQQAGVAMDRMRQILDSGEVVPQAQNPKAFPSQWENIEFKSVTFSFDHEPVLKSIDLNVKRGEMIAVVGSSGGGKSTLVNLLERFFDPTEGQISIGDTPLRDIDLKDLRRNVALVSQDVFLFADSIEKNISMGDLEKDRNQVELAAKTANIHDFIVSTEDGYQTRVGEHGSRLSGGEKQRISIARAIFKDAPILVLDEATSALDSESELEVQKGLDQLLKGRTAFVIAHRLSTITRADRILVMKAGQIVEQGTHDELMSKSGEYFRFQQLQSV